MIRRARMIAVLAIIAAGALGIISSTQTWLEATLAGSAQQVLAVPGASAVPLLAPLSLAALALGLALSIVGRVLRYVFGALALAIGAALLVATWTIPIQRPGQAVQSTVTEATGLSGPDAVATLVDSISTTAWPYVGLIACVLLLAGGALTLATAHRWRSAGRRFRADSDPGDDPLGTGDRAAAASRPRDAIDSWDDLSRGEDPTAL